MRARKNISHAITFVVAQSSITHSHQAIFDCVLTVCLKLIPIMLTSEIRDLDHLRLGDRIRPTHGYLTDLGRLRCGRICSWRLLQDHFFAPLLLWQRDRRLTDESQ